MSRQRSSSGATSRRRLRKEGIPGEPEPHWYFERPLNQLLGAGFRAGLVVDGLEEPSFRPDATTSSKLSWLDIPEFPPVLAVRFRVTGK